MKMILNRRWESKISIRGSLFVDGQEECFTLEPARVNPVNAGHPCVPAGEYRVILTPSPRLKYVTPELLDVPGRSDIRIHVGNYPKDTLGCILVGETNATDMIGNSHSAFESLMALLRTATDLLTLEINDIILPV